MKKHTIYLLFFFATLYIKGQEVNFTGNENETVSILVGSLTKGQITTGAQKLKVEIYGGDYETNSLGTTIYSIGVRSGKRITISRNNGSGNKFKLVVFEDGDRYNFVIQNTMKWPSINIKVTYLDSALNKITPKQAVEIKKIDVSNQKDVTNEFQQIIMTATDMYGNLGIGTLSPKSKLDVRGKIIADEVEIKVNTGADFVFSPDYKLKPLSEVETFVKENRHLPDIPSEKEMQENGLNLNEMQIKLLQKVEELTLYVIEQNKKIEELKEENKEIKEDNKMQQVLIEEQQEKIEKMQEKE